MKKVIAVLLLCFALLSLTACGDKSEKLQDNEVLKIDDIVITSGIFNFAMEGLLSNSIGANVSVDSPGTVAYLKQQTYDRLMQMAKGRSYCEKNGVTINRAESQKKLDEQKGTADERTWQIYLDSYGMTEDDYLWLFETNQYSSEFTELLSKDLQFTDEEIKQIYEENPSAYDVYKVSHILVKFESDIGKHTDEQIAEVKAKAQEIIDQLNNGADWNEMVQQYSDDEYTLEANGALDYTFTLENSPFVKEFTEGVVDLKMVGEYTQEPVVSSYGAHIIKLDSLVSGYENLQANIYNTVGQERYDEKYEEVMADENYTIVENKKFKEFLKTDELDYEVK